MQLKESEKGVDVGVAGGAQYMSSNAQIYTEAQVATHVAGLIEQINRWTRKMLQIKTNENTSDGIDKLS